MVKRFSVNLGAVRITENHLTSDPIKPQEVEAALAQIDSGAALSSPCRSTGNTGRMS